MAAAVLLLVFATPNALLLWIDTDRQQLLRLLASIALCAAWVAAFASVRRAIAWALPVFVLMPLITLFVRGYQEMPGTSVIGILCDTNVQEIRDFLEGRTVSVVTSLTVSLTIWVLLLRLTRDRTETGAASPRRRCGLYAARTALLMLAAFILLATAPGFSGIETIAGKGGIETSNGLKALPFGLTKLANVFPVGPAVSAADFYIGERNRHAWQARKAGRTFGAALTAGGSKPFGKPAQKTVYVLVVGESSRGDHWQLGGYGRDTNPLLSREANVVYLRDVVSPWPFTLASVPVIASRKSGTNRARFFAETSVISLFKEAGFRTYWISNQPRPGGIGSEIADISSEADERAWLNVAERDYARETTYDMALVDRLRATLAKAEPRQFIVLHLMGSHDAYQARHPAAFDVFHPSLTDAPDLNDHDRANRQAVVNSYDNSIVYTDHVLHAAIAALKASAAEAGLLYTSDHGESLYDGDCDFIGHGGTTKANYMVSALVWLSDGLIDARPEAYAALRDHAAARVSTENVFESLAGMAGIAYPGARPSQNIFSPAFAEADRSVNVGGATVNWDRADFEGACRRPVARRPGVAAR